MADLNLGPVIFDVEGDTLTLEDKELLRHPATGGLILFARHCHDREQVVDLVQQIRAIRQDCLICIDQEGGRVQRLQKGVTRLPPLAVLGKCYDKDPHKARKLAESHAWLMASEIRSCDIDISFSPLLDRQNYDNPVIGDRAFHASVDSITELALAYVTGLSRAGMPATIKHFPGHGGVTVDSHVALPHDSRPLAAIYEDMRPFIQLAQAGAQAVMPAHIVFDQVDALPVGFSQKWLQEILRQQIGFNGTIISDDLSMQGAKGLGDTAECARLALAAGCDFILVCNDRPAAIAALEGINLDVASEVQARRLAMRPVQAAPRWQQLRKSENYKRCHAAIEETLMREEDRFGHD